MSESERTYALGLNAEAARSLQYAVPVPKRRLWNPGQGLLVSLLILGNVIELAVILYEIFWRH